MTMIRGIQNAPPGEDASRSQSKMDETKPPGSYPMMIRLAKQAGIPEPPTKVDWNYLDHCLEIVGSHLERSALQQDCQEARSANQFAVWPGDRIKQVPVVTDTKKLDGREMFPSSVHALLNLTCQKQKQKGYPRLVQMASSMRLSPNNFPSFHPLSSHNSDEECSDSNYLGALQPQQKRKRLSSHDHPNLSEAVNQWPQEGLSLIAQEIGLNLPQIQRNVKRLLAKRRQRSSSGPSLTERHHIEPKRQKKQLTISPSTSSSHQPAQRTYPYGLDTSSDSGSTNDRLASPSSARDPSLTPFNDPSISSGQSAPFVEESTQEDS